MTSAPSLHISHGSRWLSEDYVQDSQESASSFSWPRPSINGRKRAAAEPDEELAALQREHPRLLKENIELRHRLLTDKNEHSRRRLKRLEQTRDAEGRLTHLQALQRQEASRALALQESIQGLRQRLGELQRATAGAMPGINVHRATISVQGPKLPAKSNDPAEPQQQLPRPEGSSGRTPSTSRRGNSSSRELQELSEQLGAARQVHRRLVEELAQERVQTKLAADEVARIRALGGGPGELREAEAMEASIRAMRSEETQAETQASYLRRANVVLESQYEAENEAATRVSKELELLRSQERQLENMLASTREAQIQEETVVAEGLSEEHAAMTASTLKWREACSEHAALKAEHHQLAGEIMEAQMRMVSREVDVASQEAAHLQVNTDDPVKLAAEVDAQEQQVQAARSENIELRMSLQATAARRIAMEEEMASLREEVASVQHSNGQKPSGWAAEAEEARIHGEAAQEKSATLQQRELELQRESDALAKSLSASKEELSSVQRKHRHLSNRMDQLVADLMQSRERQQGEMLACSLCEAKTHALGEELQRRQKAKEQQHAEAIQETKRLEQTAESTAADVRRLRMEELQMHQEMAEYMEEMQPGAVSLKRELEQLTEEHARMKASGAAGGYGIRNTNCGDVAAGGGPQRLRNAELQLAQVQQLWTVHQDQYLTIRRGLEVATAEIQASTVLRGRVEEDIQRKEMVLGMEQREELAMQARLAEEAKEADNLAAEIASSKRLMQDISTAEGTTQAGLVQLQEQKGQLMNLVASMEQGKQRLRRELHAEEDAAAQEHRRVEEVAAEPAGRREEAQKTSAEDSRLRRTIAGITATISELEEHLATKSKDAEQLHSEVATCHGMRAEFHWKLDRLQHTYQMQQGELATQVQELAASGKEVETLQAEMERLRTLAEEQKHEEALSVEDLVHMVTENQLLNQELLELQRKEKALVATGANQQEALGPEQAQALRGVELQLEQVVTAYQEALNEQKRGEAAVAELSSEGKRLEAEVESAQRSLAEAADEERSLQASVLRGDMEVSAMRARLSEAAGMLDTQEMASEEAAMKRSRLQMLVGEQQAAANQATLHDAAVDAEIEKLRSQTQALDEKLAETQLAVSEGHHRLEEAQADERHLQDLIARQRLAQQRAQVENAALRCQLQQRTASQQSSPQATASALSVPPSAARLANILSPSVKTAATAATPLRHHPTDEEAAALRRTVARQRAVIEEMTVEIAGGQVKALSPSDSRPSQPQTTSPSVPSSMSDNLPVTPSPPRRLASLASPAASHLLGSSPVGHLRPATAGNHRWVRYRPSAGMG